MAPVRPKGTNKARKSATSGPSKLKSKSTKIARPPPKQVKTKPSTTSKPVKRKAPVYTDAQLALPTLNSIIPASATLAQRKGKGTGKKKNKVYVDDKESMMTILAMVNAEKEGQIESKMIRERQLEEIREARKKEAEKRKEGKKGELEEVKQGLKKGKKNLKGKDTEEKLGKMTNGAKSDDGKKRKRVSFAGT